MDSKVEGCEVRNTVGLKKNNDKLKVIMFKGTQVSLDTSN